MDNQLNFYIDGAWVEPSSEETLDVVNPATEEVIGAIAMGGRQDVDAAVAAAQTAFITFSRTSRDERLALLERICEGYAARAGDLARTVSAEMGAPTTLAEKAQVPSGLAHFSTMKKVLARFDFESDVGTSRVVKEPVGVCALITPWNWPLNQIACKVAPALAAGCTMVLKPSEIAPLNAILLAEILDEAGVPDGVFNLVNGSGPVVGAALAAHPDVAMVSFTGSTRAGVEVARNAAATVKRVAQELGGKSANIILDDADFARAVTAGVFAVCTNTGQSCNAPTRMLVPHARMEEAAEVAAAAAARVAVGDPAEPATRVGPLASAAQFDKVQRMIQAGIDEGAELVAGGAGRPEGLERGYYARPTIFGHVNNQMTVAREEIFGPVLVLIGYEDDDDAVRIANESPYGLAGFVSAGDAERGRAVARRIRSGQVNLNGARPDFRLPFGGYKQSGNGREAGRHGLEEFLEVKAILGYHPRGG